MSASSAASRCTVMFAATFFLVCSGARGQAIPHRSTAEMQVKTLKVNDVELAYVEEGKGETVVFVHGFAGDWRTWEPLRPFISERYHYVSLSRRYHYPNRWSDAGKNYSMTQHVADVAAFIRAFNVGKVHLVGNSGGGRIVGHVALKYPELVHSAVMGEPGLIAPISPEGKAAVAASQENTAKVLAAMKSGDARKAMRLHYDAIAGEHGAWDKLPVERQRQRLDNAHMVIPTLTGVRATPVTCEELSALRVPALVVRGEKSPAVFQYREERLLGCLPKTTEVAVMPAEHHEWYAVNPEPSAKAILTFIAKHAQTPTRTWELPPGAKSLHVNGHDMAYVERGTGQPLLLVHGVLSDFRYWTSVMEPLSAKYRVIAVRLRHHYPERWNGQGGSFSMRQHVADVVAFIQKLDAGPVHLVGISGGASLAMYVATAHGELVRTLTLAEPNFPAFDKDPARVKHLFEKAAAIFKQGNVEGSLEYFIDFVNGPGSWKAIPEAGRQTFRDNASTVRGLARDTWDPYTCADAGRIGAPVLLVAGEKSPPFFGKILDPVQRCLKRSERVVIRNASHGIPRQAPAGFSEAVLNFISNRRSSMPSHAAPQRSTEEMQVKKLKVNDVELAYVEEGKGETVVFVHGGGVSDWAGWEKLRPFISKKYRYVSLSRRYHYPNPWIDDGRNYTMEQHVEDVAAFIRALKVGKVHLVGNSYGGGIVGRVALKYPELLRSLSLGERLIAPVSAEGKAAVAATQKDNEKGRQVVQAGDLRQAAILQYDRAVGEQGAFEKLPAERQKQLLYDAKTLTLERRSIEQRTELTCEQLETLKVPILLIRGERTADAQRYGFEATLSCLPNTAESAIIPGAPHSWHSRNPEDSARAILAFLAKH